MDKLLVSPNPHIHRPVSTQSLMRDVLIALAPAEVVSVLFYGWAAVISLCVCVATCVLLEWAICKWMRRPSTICDLSAAVTGVLMALNVPSGCPVWISAIGCAVAIGVAKMTFGGIGQNIFNPAITGRVFLLISFPQQMTDWTATPGFIHPTDAISGETLLGCYNEGGMAALVESGVQIDGMQMFYNVGGSMGEISAVALLAGFVYLLVRGVVKPWITLTIFATVALVSGIFSLADPAVYTGPVFNLMTGGLILGACFMATDYVTSPMTNVGGIIYGFGIGLIVMMIRYFGSYPEGVSFAILIMNMVVPLLDRWFHSKKYGRA